jgi:hypothetical protein
MKDCFHRNEAPFASHALYTQPGVLDDTVPADRAQGIVAGLAWGLCAEASVVYVDRGISSGMREGVLAAMKVGREIEFRAFDLDSFKLPNVAAFVRATVREANKVIVNLDEDSFKRMGLP